MTEITDDTEDLQFFDENFDGVSEDIFKEANFFDFPMENFEENGQDWNSLLLPSLDSFSASLSPHCGKRVDSPKLPKYNFPKDEDTYKQAWLNAKACPTSSILLDRASSDVKFSKPLRTSSPISVLESGNSYSAESAKTNFELPFPLLGNLSAQAKRARTKRPRPPTMVNSWLTTRPFNSDTSFNKAMVQLNKRKEKKKKNPSQLSNSARMNKEWLQETGGGKKCSHCEVKKTPQWREGPFGPKSLCDACGDIDRAHFSPSIGLRPALPLSHHYS